MFRVAMNLGVCVEVPEDAKSAKAALVCAKESALLSQSLWFISYMATCVAISAINCVYYFLSAPVKGLQRSLLFDLRGAASHFSEQMCYFACSLACSVLGIYLLAESIFKGMETASQHIIIGPPASQPPQAQSIQVEQWLSELLTTLLQQLFERLTSLHPKGGERFSLLARERIQVWLRYQQLPTRLQEMIRDIRQSPEIREFFPQERPQDEAHVQNLLQNLLPDLLDKRLWRLLNTQALPLKHLCEKSLRDFIQDPLQIELQDMLKEALSTLRKELCQPVIKQLKQERLQDVIQDRIRCQTQHHHLATLIEPLKTLCQGLLVEDSNIFCPANLPAHTRNMFCSQFQKCLKTFGRDQQNLFSRQDIVEICRPDLVADIVLYCYIDSVLVPLKDFIQNERQESLTNLQETLRNTLYKLIKGDESGNKSLGLRDGLEEFLLNLRVGICQSLLDLATPPPGMEKKHAQPLQIGPLQVWLRQEGWWRTDREIQITFYKWLQRLFIDLSQGLFVNLPSQATPTHVSGLPAVELQKRLRKLLQQHLSGHIQHMFLGISLDQEVELGGLGVTPTYQYEQKQSLVIDSLSEILPGWLSECSSELFLQNLYGDSTQNELQRHLQDRLPNLRQSLFRMVLKKLFENFPETVNRDLLQNSFQDLIQNHFQRRIQLLGLSQFRNVFLALRQKCLCRDRVSMRELLLHISQWAENKMTIRLNKFLEDNNENVHFCELFQGVSLPRQLRVLRSDLLVDLLLDILLDLLEEALPEPLLLDEDQLPVVYEALNKVLDEGIIEEAGRGLLCWEESLQIVRAALKPTTHNLSNLASAGG